MSAGHLVAITSDCVWLPGRDEATPATLIVSLESGTIVKILPSRLSREELQEDVNDYVDYRDKWILPGLVDCHVHLNEPGRTEWEGFRTGTIAAVSGGVTTLIDMPLNAIPPTTTVENLQLKLDAAKGQCFVDVGFWGGVIPGNEKDLKPLVNEGVKGFKSFLCESGVEEFPRVNEEQVLIAMKELEEAKSLFLFHAELEEPASSHSHNDEQPSNPPDVSAYSTFLSSRPSSLEDSAISLILRCASQHPTLRTHIVHLSASSALPTLEQARIESKLPITVETCFHYLCLNSEQVEKGNTLFKCCPPIRNDENREKLWKGLLDGTIDFIVSDHSPCVTELKKLDQGDFMTAWGGIGGLGLGLSLLWSECRKREIGMKKVLEWCSEKPAHQVGLEKSKGGLFVGGDADFVVFDPQEKFTVDKTSLHFKNRASPYEGMTLQGVVNETWLRGGKVWDRQLVATQGGMFQPETPSRVLRRIQDLNQQSLPDLPGLPADQTTFSEDGDSTIAHSPPPRNSQSTRVGSPILPPSTSPYTSTPAPSSSLFHRSQSNVAPSTTSTRYSGNDTTSTARPPPRQQLANSLRRNTQGSEPRDDLESSINDTMSEIGKRAGASSEEDEDMVVLSASGGEEESDMESAGLRVAESVDLSELPEPREELTETTREDETETSDERERHPLDSLDANDSLDRQSENLSTKRILPSALSPLRDRDLNSTATIATPELGRNYSPKHSLQDSLLSDQTPSRNSAGDKTPTASFTPVRLGTPTLDSPIASLHQDSNLATPHANHQTDAARRANHLLTTLRSTAKPRFLRGTPHPLRSARRSSTTSSSLAPPNNDDDQRSTSSFASDHSSNDLTTFHPKANTSLPSGGTTDLGGGGATTAGSRFNGAKLNAYLHQLNTHLTEENQQLVKTLKKTTDDNERLQYTIREMSVAGGISVDSSSSRRRQRTSGSGEEEEDEIEGSRIGLLGKELEGLVDGQRRIRGLQDQFGEGQLGGGKDARAKIQELEEELERVRQQGADKDDEIRQLRDRVVSDSPKTSGGEDDSSTNLVANLQQEVFDLKDALDTASSERDAAQADLVKLEADFTAAGQASEKDFANLQGRIDELLEDLQEKDIEVEAVKQLLVDQETEFAEKMEELEKELSKVMEEQEKKVESARDELETKRKEDEIARKSEKEALDRLKSERDELEQRLEKEGRASNEQVEMEISSLRRDLKARDEELVRMHEELEAVAGNDDRLEELERQIKAKDEEIQQLEGALDESASQLLQNEDDLAALRQQLASEKQVNSSLSAQISQFSVVKAKSPLGNEVFNNSDKDDVIASLEEELEEARQEIIQLHGKLASTANEERSVELRDLEIQNLETTKANLEDRVKSLRQQVSIQFSPSQTPDKSWLLRPLPAVRTPKTPGQFLSNLSNWSSGSAANETISPLLAQIHELEQMVEHLQTQLVAANAQIDNKLDRLEAAGFDTISIARQLSTAQSRIAELEAQLERLLGENGSIEKVRAKLTRVHCPDCSSTFDANKVVQLRVDQGGIAFEGFTTQGKAVDSLRSDLASAHAKLEELKTEVNVLRSQASRSKDLSSDKATLLSQQESLSKDLQQARNEIAILETDLRTERSRLRTLTNEQSAHAKAKMTLESRIAQLEAELSKNVQTSATSSELDSLRSALHAKEAEQRRLLDERGDILRGVANLQSDMNRVRQEAISLGLDLQGVRRERDEFAKRQAEEKSLVTLDSKTIEDLRARHKQESKGLLVLVRQLKLRVNREVQFRYQAGEQKDYLSQVVKEKQATINSIMSQLSLPLPSEERPRPSLRGAALAICALSRMRRLSQQWKEDSVPKKRLREIAYPQVRGKPYPA